MRAEKSFDWCAGIVKSALVGGVFSICATLIVPIQTHIAVSAFFSYGLSDLIASLAPISLSVFLGAGALLSLACRYCGFRPHAVCLGVALALLLEAGILSVGLPELNGDFRCYGSVLRAVMDSMALLAIVGAFLFFARQLERHLLLASAAIILFASSTLFDVRRQNPCLGGETSAELEKLGVSMAPRIQVLKSARYATGQNVLLLIVDSVSSEVALSVFDAHPELAAAFPGFTFYANNVGMHPGTTLATTGIMTGRHYDGSVSVPEYIQTQFSPIAVFSHYLGEASAVYDDIGASNVGLSNRLLPELVSKGGEGLPARDVRMRDMFPWSVSELSVFRMTPYGLKRKLLKRLSAHWHEQADKEDCLVGLDGLLWPYLAKVRTDDALRRTFHVHHSAGGHPPLHFTENGEWIRDMPTSYASYVRQCTWVFRCLANLMTEYSRRGLYDDSLIVICADHGVADMASAPPLGAQTEKPLPSSAIPMLMVKPQGQKGELRRSSSPTSHAQISRVLKAAVGARLSADDVDRLLHAPIRLYREIGNGKLCDWRVDVRDNVAYAETPLGVRKALEPLELGKSYGFNPLEGNCARCEVVSGDVNLNGLVVEAFGRGIVRFPVMTTESRVMVEIETRTHFVKGNAPGEVCIEMGGVVDRFKVNRHWQAVDVRRQATVENGWVTLRVDNSSSAYALAFRSIRFSRHGGD